MKEYVAVPDALLGKTKELKKYLDLIPIRADTHTKTHKEKALTLFRGKLRRNS